MKYKTIFVSPYSDFEKEELEELLNEGWEIVRADPSISIVTLGPKAIASRESEGGMFYILKKDD